MGPRAAVDFGAVISYMVDNDDFPRPQELLGNDDGTQRVDRPAARVADDVGVAFRQAEGFGGIESRVHACDDGHLAVVGARSETGPVR